MNVSGKRKEIFGNVNCESENSRKKRLKRMDLQKNENGNGNDTKCERPLETNCNPEKIRAHNSINKGRLTFSKMISPIKISHFFKRIWEKKPLCVTRQKPSYYEKVCTMDDFKGAFASKEIKFSENVDVTSYVNGVKTTENPDGRATPELVFDFYNKGKSIRLLNPQTFIRKVRIFTTKLQDYFRCFVGSNIYLTPGNSQGFAPHYDDVEAFVLQLAGRKEWRIYKPRPGEELPRFSSGNFTDVDIGLPILKIILEPGDLLYFPRGVIHQARSLEEGSMHITVSCYQRNSWADFLEKLLPVALQTAVEEDVEYRKGLPRTYLDHLGAVVSDKESKQREKIVSHIENLVHKLCNYLPLDSCADQFGKNFVHDALPPILTKGEKKYAAKDLQNGLRLKLKSNWNKNLKVKLIRAYACRLVCEGENFRLYYSTKNGLVYHEVGHRCIKLSSSWVAAADLLIQQYPDFTDIKDLVTASEGMGDAKDVFKFIEILTKRGLILFNRVLSDGKLER